ncbi:MAG: outer membrane protein assembly factor BamA [Spirochaetaceae bacterium 4572_59]|nr:MAG: outer membrane protein assembly factor BamA [Spirochaetaceae bacterium 4572_59]
MLKVRFPLILVILTILTFNLAAQEDPNWYQNKPILDIRFSGLDAVSETELKGIVRQYVSLNFTDAISWEIQGKLYALEYFDLILPQALPGDDNNNTVVLEFVVKEKPVVKEILFTGNNRIRKGELLDTILLTKGDMVNKSFIEQDSLSLKNLYIEKGYIDSEITFVIEKNEEKNTASIVFDIYEGDQTTISELNITGNDKYVTTKTLQGLIKTKPQSLFHKGVLMENQLQEDISMIEAYYWDRGFVDAKVSDVVKDIIRDEEEGVNNLIITLVITEGEPYTFNGISFQGNNLYSDEELMNMISQETGATFNKTRFQIDYQKVTDRYYENGYIYNSFSYEEVRDEEALTVSYIVNIAERDRAHIENVIIRGNDKTKDHVIERELTFDVGDVFSKTKVMQSMENLYNTQYFSVVEPQTYPGSEEGLMDLVIDVEEGKTANIIFGITFSGGAEFPLAGTIQWNDSNFLGLGTTVGVESTFSPSAQSLSLKYTEPRLFGTRWGIGTDLTYSRATGSDAYLDMDGDGVIDPYSSQEEFEDSDEVVPSDYLMEYDTQKISAGINTGYTWHTGIGRLSSYTGVRTGVKSVDYDESVYRPWDEDLRDNNHSWSYEDSWWVKGAWDTRDYVGNPSSGFILSETVTIAGVTALATTDYLKSVTRGQINFTLWDLPVSDTFNFKTVFTLNSAFSYLTEKPWDKESLIDPQENGFYADGMFVARGWYPESDGQSMWDNTATLKIPLIPNILAYDIFLDAVGLWKSKDYLNEMSLPDFKFSLGTGIRFDNPQFPIGIYLVKKFQFAEGGGIDWNPEPDYVTFDNGKLNLVVSFGIDIY